ncbi:amino acid/amide ABC transporter membrane protein 2, HAAT family [Jatrophihabitans endophyticus]|uniref:Amino acid/amide ABC transporter membrane protein 2, HAAT family n=1 Tax=Jatrophihabitans endophyticus TaxID=1206085 RepID=A0A1M5M087_9ACTN|nr:branched-chain amino acid ABC transporter permease [Jatrophihabitans endophyticus]SHG70668.1 amino acid/amide ABC transporter membrane protein 2, HAAT family [Jatrophihabitans endophyticus]
MSTVFDTAPESDASAPATAARHPDVLWARHGVALLVVVVLAAFAPVVLPASQQAVAVQVLIFAIMAVGWNLMSGFGGMFNFGNAAYFGVGAYADAYLLVEHGVSPWFGMLAGAALAAALAALIGFLTFRYRVSGAYFALATFAFAEILRLVATNTDLVNRSIGYNVPLLQDASWTQLQFPAGDHRYYWTGLALLALAMLVTIGYLRSRSGQYTVAIRDDEAAASSLGVNVLRYRLQTMALSGAITAVAGAFYTQYFLFVNPDLAFSQNQSIQSILPAVIGGVGTIWGPLIGACIVGPLSNGTSTLLRHPPDWLMFLQGRSGLDVVIYAVLLILIVLLLPKGIYGTVRDRLRR